MKFSETIKAVKNKHSSDAATGQPLNAITEEAEYGAAAAKSSKRKRKPKMLQIFNEEATQKKKRRVDAASDAPLPAKPENFRINLLPAVTNKIKNGKAKRVIQKTSAGSFEIESLPKTQSPFVVTTLQYDRSLKFSSLKEKTLQNSNVKRESAAELLRRKKKQKKLQTN